MNKSDHPSLGRRQFVKGVATAALALPFGMFSPFAWAYDAISPVLNGTTFDLEIAPLPVNFTGQASMATAVNGLLPGPVLKLKEGDSVTIRVTNRLDEMTTIHWHGIIL
ncbi:MAG: multicopper oxidase domain-containing protein, partial [Gallionella sp.]